MSNFKLIGVSGRARSGKDLFFSIVDELYGGHFWESKKFAAKLKTICSLITGKPESWFYDHKYYDMIIPEYGISIRELQQQIGTEVFRNNLSENVWVNALFADYISESRWIITDVRFPNEAEAIKERNGTLIRIERPSLPNDDKHASEISLDYYTNWDYVIQNDGTIEDYRKEIIKIIQ